ncbi:TadE/TadG family type IV pilus assembly protein [Bradyrhizobium archetypum]|uniref:TadE/TadG family protein n=1 Tax=Bradyrhizobium archetypum TaxID=2721160 RepID=A0A7Y4H7X0_9BRAD|nr:pilus assembly protein [Bradyrhizobium archetypum]NOJ49266.1 TadE/TadG family protein [Bradyrhizobium archetypum]
MLDTVVFRRIRTAARRFAGANEGNIAILFGIAVIPIITFVGAAIDYTRASSARSSMQAALDSTALMLGKDLTEGTITASQISDKADAYFRALYTNTEAKSVAITASYTQNSGKGSTVLVNGSGAIDTGFMRVVGYPTLGFNTSSTSAWGSKRMRVAMVLDNTGSMDQNGKMDAMKKAATDMITDLSKYWKKTGDVYISIIPFAKDVNVGTANVNASWINWSEWEAEPPILNDKNASINADFKTAKAGSDCPFTRNTHGFVCMDRPATQSGAQTRSTIPSNGYICPGLDNGKWPGKANIYYNGCYTTTTGSSASCGAFDATRCTCSGSGSSKVCHFWRGDDTAATAAARPAHSTWTGCINDRDQPNDTTNIDPGSSNDGTPSKRFYAEQWSQCIASTVTPMSDSWQTLKDQVNAMTANGNTNQAVGLAWGWQSLSTENGPIKAPSKDSDYIYQDFIVLLSDGLNTQNRWSSSTSSIDARQKILCQNIKDDKLHPVTVFTIQVNINKIDPQSQVLKECATPDGSFQMITSATQTSDAFKNILTQISKLRVAK